MNSGAYHWGFLNRFGPHFLPRMQKVPEFAYQKSSTRDDLRCRYPSRLRRVEWNSRKLT
ncbi:hypothetical protein Pla144_18280 [Bythopirellula polymerisocia]|uniref:Uncharacterized protein n=1 Tax=Bythopirellula polymerisocia TaxID=2528003 RepID=A0A5C6CVR7_9BACT|nr:hypothetical protein Pla144_18280 [Bythopirellula polymerisocia]